MAVLLKDLITQVQHMNIKLIAGEKGLSNIVSWTHMVDNDKISEFLEGNEVTFTTGLGLNENLKLIDLVKGVYNNGASAIVINIGPYIREIGSDVIDFANDKNFPVFQVPWEVHMAEIMRIFCFSLAKSEQSSIEIKSSLNNAIFCNKQEELYVGPLLQKGYLSEWKYYFTLIEVEENGKEAAEYRLEELCLKLEKYALYYHKGILVYTQNKKIFMVLSNYNEGEIKDLLKSIFKEFCSFLKKSERCYFSIGNTAKGIRNIHKSYNQALKLSKIHNSEEAPFLEVIGKNKLIFYKDIGIYKLLMCIDDIEVIQEYIKETVQPLHEYDKAHKSDLSKVLKSYIRHSGKVKETSEELFVHRNTVNYKINKAEDILDIDLSDLEERLRLKIGFMLYELINER